MPCTICQHPQCRDIDQALIAGSATLAALSQEYGLSTSALHRHQAHLQAKVNRVKDQLQDNLRQGCLFWLSQALEIAKQTAQVAQEEGNSKLALQAIQQGTRILGIILKQDLQLDDRVVYEILTSPQWATQASLLPNDPKIMSISRQSLAGALSSPCPETADPPPSPASRVDLDLRQQLLPGLVSPSVTQPKIEKRKLEPENHLFQQWEKSGKLPGNIPLSEYIYEQSLRDSQCKKLMGKELRPQPPRPAKDAGASLVEA